jgi:hypothetical protein
MMVGMISPLSFRGARGANPEPMNTGAAGFALAGLALERSGPFASVSRSWVPGSTLRVAPE